MTKVEILGSYCGSCRLMEATARQAAARLSLDCEIVKVTDPFKFIGYGITAIPALVVDGKVLAVGRVPKLPEMEALLIPSENKP